MEEELNFALEEEETLEVKLENDVIGGTSDYEKLKNQPSINDVTLIGNKSLDDLDIQPKGDYANSKITNSELEEIFKDW